jgi:hypothetical protein
MDLVSQTWLNLKANRTRSLLTMFGIAWGLICLILMTAMDSVKDTNGQPGGWQ